jgi:uncharacterized repeat protein (TIGR01451 family)
VVHFSRLLAVAGVFTLALATNKAHAVGAPAGSSIDNTAIVTYSVGSVTATTTSNPTTVTVAEILDVVVTLQTPNVPVVPGATQQEMLYRVTNAGNGPEAFLLTMSSVIGGDEFDPVAAAPSIYFDTDASGDLSPGDVPYVAGGNDPVLNADAFVAVLVVNDIPAAVSDGNRGRSSLSAAARTGTGTAGDEFLGAGAGGTIAVVGTTGADGIATGEYLVSGVTVNAVKSATVADQFAGQRPIPGATINYSIVVTATGSGSALSTLFSDAIPANTTYVPGTLTLNSVALSDATDADVGEFTNAPTPRVRVQLGTLTTASGPQTIQFAVTIN